MGGGVVCTVIFMSNPTVVLCCVGVGVLTIRIINDCIVGHRSELDTCKNCSDVHIQDFLLVLIASSFLGAQAHLEIAAVCESPKSWRLGPVWSRKLV